MKDDKGFTILEVVIAMLIIGIITVPALGLFSSSLQLYDRSTESTIAINLAQLKMEEIIGTDVGEYERNPVEWKKFSEYTGYNYQVDINLESPASSETPNLYRVDVRVRYQAGGQPQNLSLSTYLVDK